MVDVNLSIQDFQKYFRNHKLGKLFFPNGRCKVPIMQEDILFGKYTTLKEAPFYVPLSELYKAMVGWKIKDTEIQLDEVVGIIAFGSAVRYPGYRIEYTKKRKFLFGPRIYDPVRIPLNPKDADFLVITENNMTRETHIDPLIYEGKYGNDIIEGGIHLVNRGLEQVINGINEGDTVSRHALTEGIPLFYSEKLTSLYDRLSMNRNPNLTLYWDEDARGNLQGKIVHNS